jgi:tagatose-6-phosphate ketose/aldose isomerase
MELTLDSFVSLRYVAVPFDFYPNSGGLSRFVGLSKQITMGQPNDLDPGLSVTDWLSRLSQDSGEIGALLRPSWDDQLASGYGHTLREIAQQPVTWLETASRVLEDLPRIEAALVGAGLGNGGGLVLTGSGSSLYAGECLALPLQSRLRMPVAAVGAGQLLTHPVASLPPVGPYALVSFARSGNSPESRAVVDSLLDDPRVSHLILTCNRQGTLATGYGDVARVHTLVLDEKTNDKSLVMTSSFTNLVLAGRFLGFTQASEAYLASTRILARGAAWTLQCAADTVARIARSGFTSAVYLASGWRMGAAHEAALKMLEMNDGRVSTLPESYLGLRHGPMSAIHDETLIVAFLSSDPVVRAYESDLIRELDRKKLGARRVIIGASVPKELAPGPDDAIVDVAPAGALGDEEMVLIDVLAGQLLAFFRCLSEGLRPDSPSTDGVISRVVSGFEIHSRPS